MKKSGELEKTMSVVVVVCGLWFTFHFFPPPFFPQPSGASLGYNGRVRDGEVDSSFCCYLPPICGTVCYPPLCGLSLSHHENQVDGKSLGSWAQVVFKERERERGVHLYILIWVYFTYLFNFPYHPCLQFNFGFTLMLNWKDLPSSTWLIGHNPI